MDFLHRNLARMSGTTGLIYAMTQYPYVEKTMSDFLQMEETISPQRPFPEILKIRQWDDLKKNFKLRHLCALRPLACAHSCTCRLLYGK
jgi:hypothetical protein